MKLARAMEIQGFYKLGTGGGCDSFQKDGYFDGQEAYLLVTDATGNNMPTSPYEPVILGIYDFQIDEELYQQNFATCIECLSWCLANFKVTEKETS